MPHATMSKEEILNSGYLDIIYDGRNKSYGGYELRKNYNKRVAKTFGMLLSAGLLLAGYGVLHAGANKQEGINPKEKIIEMSTICPTPQPPKITPPLPPRLPQPKVAMQRVTPPKIEKDENVKVEDVLPEQNKTLQVGPKTETGDLVDMSPVITTTTKGTGVVPPPPNPNNVFTYVEQMPAPLFNLSDFLEKNLRYPEQAREVNVQGVVYVKFVVNADGSISDASITKGIGAGCDEEAKRVVANMPNWKPGKQNGNAVRVYFILPIHFRLE